MTLRHGGTVRCAKPLPQLRASRSPDHSKTLWQGDWGDWEPSVTKLLSPTAVWGTGRRQCQGDPESWCCSTIQDL